MENMNIIDIKTDVIDHPNRPLPRKMITINNAYYLLFVSILIGCIASLFINNMSLIFLYFLIIPLLFLYPLYLKKIPLLGNIVVAFLISSVFIFSECVVLKSYTILIIPSLLIFGLSLIREIIKDIHDYEQEALKSIQSHYPAYDRKELKSLLTDQIYDELRDYANTRTNR